MQATQIIDYAQRLYRAHGNQAEYEAASRQQECEKRGDKEQAETWNRIRLAIREIRH
ncbi:hypothetical protein [Emcibacter sp. SYSU 3D8]|uniref:hypothetical protein n=1 Tax=Emcibacter sp. SYSU 3D8 TaxID=3133969 RepID=UPI0031FEF381